MSSKKIRGGMRTWQESKASAMSKMLGAQKT